MKNLSLESVFGSVKTGSIDGYAVNGWAGVAGRREDTA